MESDIEKSYQSVRNSLKKGESISESDIQRNFSVTLLTATKILKALQEDGYVSKSSLEGEGQRYEVLRQGKQDEGLAIPSNKVGCDVVFIPRIKAEEGFAAHILSPREMEIYHSKNNKAEFLAGRFAAKESFMKAVGTGMVGIAFREIEVLYHEGGEPYILYKGREYPTSISHDGDYAFAVTVLL